MKKKLLTAIFAIVGTVCAAFCLTACGGQDVGGSSNGGEPSGTSPAVGAIYEPLVTRSITAAKVEAEAGSYISNCSVEITAEYALYTSREVKDNGGEPYSTDSEQSTVQLTSNSAVVADDDLEQNVKTVLSTIDWNGELSGELTPGWRLLFDYKYDFVKAKYPEGYFDDYTTGTQRYAQAFAEWGINSRPDESCYDVQDVAQQISSVLEVKLKSNENNPVRLNLRVSGSGLDGICRYVNYKYSDLAVYFPGKYEQSAFGLSQEDFGFLGKYAEAESFVYKLGFNTLKIAKTHKGVHYSVQASVADSPLFGYAPAADTKIYDGAYLTDDIYFKDKTISLTSDGTVITFATEDISHTRKSSDEAQIALKLYTDSDYKQSDVTTSLYMNTDDLTSPSSMEVNIPDMEVYEAADKCEEIAVTLKYSDGFEVELGGTQYSSSRLRAVYSYTDSEGESISGSISLNDYIKTKMKSSPAPQSVQCYISDSITNDAPTDYDAALSATASFTLSKSFGYSKFNDKNKIAAEYYELQDFEIPQDLKVINYYYDSYSGYSYGNALPEDETAVDGKLFAVLEKNVRERVTGKVTISLASDGMRKPELCDVLEVTVKRDTVTAVDVKLSPFFSGIIVGEDIDVTDCFIEVTMAHGQRASLPMTADMIGDYAQTTGTQDVRITYGEASATVEMQVRKIKSISVAEGLDKYYLLNDTPSPEVWLKATFTDNDYDYILCPADRTPELDLTKTGGGSVTIEYGGASTTFSYTVIEGAYVTYSESNGSITLNKFNTGLPAEGTAAFVPEDVKNVVIPEEINGVPVAALGANLFKGQSILRTLVVPACVKTVSYGVVDGCANLEKLTVSGEIPLSKFFAQYKPKTMTSDAVYPNVSEKLEVIISGTALCDNFFADLYLREKTIAKLTFGGNIEDFGEQSESDLKYVRQFTDGGSEKVFIKDDVIFTDEGATLAFYSAFKQDTDYVIPAGVTAANVRSNYITELTIPAKVATLGEYFMDSSESLAKVVIAAGSEITALADGAFSGCAKLTVFNFPENLTTIGAHVLSGAAIEQIILPATVTTVASSAFYNAKCTRFYIPTGATQSFVYNQYGGSYLTLPALTALAYDGSVACTKLVMFADSFTKQNVELYITGEKPSVSDEWFSYSASNKISKLYVCKEAANFSHSTFNSGNVVYEKNGETVVRWWQA